MKWMNKILCLIIYVSSAVVVIRCTIYFIMRFNEVVAYTESFYVVLAILYLLILYFWCVFLLVGDKALKNIKSTFFILGGGMLMLSVAYVGLFHLSLLPKFEPLELIFVVYDLSLLGAVISFFALIVGRKNIIGIANAK